MNIREALAHGSSQLVSAGVEGAERDARILLASILDQEPTQLFLSGEEPISTEKSEKFTDFIAARMQFQPVSQIIGGREFWGRWFSVTPDVLDPRPETETLIEVALAGPQPSRILDMGTGSGILAVTLAAEWTFSQVTATDISARALHVAEKNAATHAVSSRVSFEISDWFEAISGTYDLIVSNPPYISAQEMESLSIDVRDWEPHLALTPGGDGLGAYRIIAHKLDKFLSPNGYAIFEIGYLQGVDAAKIFEEVGFKDVTISKDLGGHNRIVVVKR